MNALRNLCNTVKKRREYALEGSYTCYLFDQGLDKILKKIGEEMTETVIAAKNSDKQALVEEICDLTFHVCVLMEEKGISLEEVAEELGRRSNQEHNLKIFHKTDKNT